MSMLLGGFDSGSSTLMFEKDISQLAKPQIKGRAFLQSGNDIIETQTYYIKPEESWVFDEDLKMTYTNPIFLKQKKKRKEPIDDSGFMPQIPLDEPKDDESKSLLKELNDEAKESLFNSSTEKEEQNIRFKLNDRRIKIEQKLNDELEQNKEPINKESKEKPKTIKLKLDL